MAVVTFTRQRIAKNGMGCYKITNKRSNGTAYFDKKLFPNGPPATLRVEADGIFVAPEAEPVAPAEKPTEADANAAAQA